MALGLPHEVAHNHVPMMMWIIIIGWPMQSHHDVAFGQVKLDPISSLSSQVKHDLVSLMVDQIQPLIQVNLINESLFISLN